MPNIKSAEKRVQLSEKARLENNAKKSRIKTFVKKYNAAVAAADFAQADELLKETISLINKAKSDGIYHANTASRKIATLSRALEPLKQEAAAKAAAEAAKATAATTKKKAAKADDTAAPKATKSKKAAE